MLGKGSSSGPKGRSPLNDSSSNSNSSSGGNGIGQGKQQSGAYSPIASGIVENTADVALIILHQALVAAWIGTRIHGSSDRSLRFLRRVAAAAGGGGSGGEQRRSEHCRQSPMPLQALPLTLSHRASARSATAQHPVPVGWA